MKSLTAWFRLEFAFTVLLLSVISPNCHRCHANLTAERKKTIYQQYNAHAEEYCHPPCETAKSLDQRVISIKLAEYYSKVNTHIATIDRLMQQQKKNFSISEGHTLNSLSKVRLLSELADDPRVHNICEIGFNAGYSALNFLVSNPNATLLVFDIFAHDYPGFAVQSLQIMFSNRKITAVAGSSQRAVLDAVAVMDPSFKCQLIFIDGDHSVNGFTGDMSNMKALADPDFHHIVIDDLNDHDLYEAYQVLKFNGFIEEVNMIEGIESSSCIAWQLSTDGQYFEFDEGSEECLSPFRGRGLHRVGVARYVF